jgi:fatty acid desaturase
MLPRRREDYRTLIWVGVFAPLVIALQYRYPACGLWLLPLSCYLAIAAGVIAHNHMHRPVLSAKWANELFSCWISVLYGYPVFAWLPTHNLNHHKLVNRRGDATITWRYTNQHNVWVAGSYFFVSAWFQSAWIKDYIRVAKRDKPEVFRRIVLQYIVVVGAHAAAIAFAVRSYGLRRGLVVWAFAMGIPACSALWTIMLFNYCQHVHTDPWSAHDHSRNFEGRLLNFLLFGNGYHTVHHEQASLHWADARLAHFRLRPLIDPRLCELSMFAFFARQYLLAPFWPTLGTVQIGRAPFDELNESSRPALAADAANPTPTAAMQG